MSGTPLCSEVSNIKQKYLTLSSNGKQNTLVRSTAKVRGTKGHELWGNSTLRQSLVTRQQSQMKT